MKFLTAGEMATRIKEMLAELRASRCAECDGSGIRRVVRYTDTCPFCRGSGRSPTPSGGDQ